MKTICLALILDPSLRSTPTVLFPHLIYMTQCPISDIPQDFQSKIECKNGKAACFGNKT